MRIEQIAKQERIRIETKAMEKIIVSSNNDIRQVINIL